MKKQLFLIILTLLFIVQGAGSAGKPDSLLTFLDRTVASRQVYAEQKEERIDDMKRQKKRLRSPDEKYHINEEIIGDYESFICDSAELYIHENLALAGELGNEGYIADSKLRLTFVYSLSGLFVQATDVFRSIDYDALHNRQKIQYCWNSIRYYENLIKYTDDPASSVGYEEQIRRMRRTAMGLLEEGSEEYMKEMAFELQDSGAFNEALGILVEIFGQQEPDTHGYAMAAMSIAKVYRMMGDRASENEFLKRAAITDIRFAVKENEALLTLAQNLFEEGDVDRSYNYINVALSDANFYNSRFRNTVIARVQPIIESNYLNKIDKQRNNLRLLAILLSILVVTLIVTLSIIFGQMKIVVRARKNLRAMNRQLVNLNRKLGEANIVKEEYIGHFMNQCMHYINKLDTYRKDINHKVKSGQIDRLYKPSDRELEKEVEELYRNFDEAFLNLYPDFVDEFNSLLESDVKYVIDGNRLNTELRIFALMRLGITNVNQIAEFLRCSLQTIYNYKSKVKNRARADITNIEEEVRRLGLTVSQPNTE